MRLRAFRHRPTLEFLENRTVPTVLSTGHVDIGIAFEAGAWDLHVGDEVNNVEYEPGDALLLANAATKTTQPSSGFRFIGGAPGSDIWVLPQVQDFSKLWPGFGAEEITPGTFGSYFESDSRIQSEGEWIRIDLIDVRGPDGGKFSVWETNQFGNPTVWMSTQTTRPVDSFFIQAGDEIHVNWGFTKTGIYEVDFRASAFLGPGATNQTQSDVITYNFGVEDCGGFCPFPAPDGAGTLELRTFTSDAVHTIESATSIYADSSRSPELGSAVLDVLTAGQEKVNIAPVSRHALNSATSYFEVGFFYETKLDLG